MNFHLDYHLELDGLKDTLYCVTTFPEARLADVLEYGMSLELF